MGNTLLTPSIIAREALIVLVNNLVMGGLVHRDFDSEFAKVGDTVTVRKPATFTAAAYNGSTVTKQDAKESSVAVKMDTLMDVTFAVTSKDMTLTVQDFSEQFIAPAMRAHAQAIDSALCGLALKTPYTSDSTKAFGELGAITAARKVLNDNKAPLDQRRLVVGTTADAAMLNIPAIVNAEKSGTTDALRTASIGKVFGFDTFMDQNIVNHTAGQGTTAGKCLIDLVAGYVVGDTAIHVDAVASALTVGDALVIGGNKYVVTVAGALSTNDQDITVYPPLKTVVANDAEVTIISAATAKDENLAFHRNGLCLVSRPLATPMGAANSQVISYNGLGVRVVYDYDMDLKSDVVSLDMLWGVKMLDEALVVRAQG